MVLRPVIPVIDVNVNFRRWLFCSFNQQIVMADFRFRNVGHQLLDNAFILHPEQSRPVVYNTRERVYRVICSGVCATEHLGTNTRLTARYDRMKPVT